MENNFEIHEIDGREGENKFRLRFQASSKQVQNIIVLGEKTKKLEEETGCRIQIPTVVEGCDIVITGSNRDKVAEMYSTMQTLLYSSRITFYLTHLVSLPFNVPQIQRRFENFKNEVLKLHGEDEKVINENIFQNPLKLHLTIGVLTLMDENDREVAVRTLHECQKHVDHLLQSEDLSVRMRGLDVMGNNLKRVNVLYSKVESDNGVLQQLVDDVSAHYMRTNLMKEPKDKSGRVKLHVTLMNSQFLMRKIRKHNSSKRRKIITAFDATNIMNNLKDFDFGEMKLNCIHLSKMNFIDKNGYYMPEAQINWGTKTEN